MDKLIINQNGGIFQTGLTGEKNQVFTEDGSKKVEWSDINGEAKALTWYKVKSPYILNNWHTFLQS